MAAGTGPLAVDTVRAFAGRPAADTGSSSISASSSGDSGSVTTSSSGSSRPSASRIETRPGPEMRGARRSVSGFAPTGSRSGRDSRNSRTASMMRETGVPVKIRRPSVANPEQTMPEPTGDSTRDRGWAASAPTSPAEPASASCGSKTPGLPRRSETNPRTPSTRTTNPIDMRTRSSAATSRSRTTPQ